MEKWSTFESEIQSHRANMISSQSFLLAVGGVFYEKNNIIVIACATLAFIQLWYIWFRVITIRKRITDYHLYDLGEQFNNKGNKEENSANPLTENVYAKNKVIRKKVNKCVPGLYKKTKLTRFKLDVLLPLSFSLLWVLILVFALYNLLTSGI